MKKFGSARDPLWFKDAIIYEAHVKAFYDSNDDGVGDFQGMISKLDYLQELGVTCLWILPFFPSPLKDDGYDIADYEGVHASYGTPEDFRRFLRAAHERGLQVLIELVVNHTSDQHPWFQRARLAPIGSAERDFYVWSDTEELYKDARIIFTDTERSNWTWDAEAKQYYWHRFFSHQPDLNYDNPLVLQEVLRVLRYWLDMGVDGIRLDAIPYLIERPGTNCENLPETHVLIKRIRAEMDAHYANRMILAEANQWPLDVRPYFGDGDECHMAFHFPLMPRMFMALRLEDRLPITEILAQTPEIPPDCQWGIFLRNHDELTLEMVTDEERDYMYFAYSQDPRMKINVGIRRRLAPLMENNRRRIELLNSLLFSFPGTPILYYGDEIGMGDNIYLGDRNGVRTPMQWNADRNGGFSRANPAALYHPLIMDPVYGYQAVNVEAQQSDPSSLLHWTRNMIALRKVFKAFGRGTLEFLHPANRKVLAYLRKYQDELILCVANLSRFPQPVELDLSRYCGMVPREVLGYNDFPPIKETPYPLTLGPYGFYWFELQGAPVAEASTITRETRAAVQVTAGWEDLLEGPARDALERAMLPQFLETRRWFRDKGRGISVARIIDWAELSLETLLTILRVEFCDGQSALYLLPIRKVFGAAAAPESGQCFIHRTEDGGQPSALCEASADPAVSRTLLGLLAAGNRLSTKLGTLVGVPVPNAPLPAGAVETPAKSIGVEQSNTSLLAGATFLKLYRRLDPGVQPDVEIGTALAGSEARVPALYGSVVYERLGEEPITILIAQQASPNHGDGWARYKPSLENGAPEGIAAMRTLGEQLAGLHIALAAATGPDFAPEPLEGEALTALVNSVRAHAQGVLHELQTAGQGQNVLTRRDDILRALELPPGNYGQRIRVHGDLHLGQVLVVEDGFLFIDFEGEPARTAAERRAKHSPLKDVAGMVRSFGYAAARQLDQARAYEEAFLQGYLARAEGQPFLPQSREAFDALLRLFVLDKAVYEIRYELRNRPDWLEIPVLGLLGLLGGKE